MPPLTPTPTPTAPQPGAEQPGAAPPPPSQGATTTNEPGQFERPQGSAMPENFDQIPGADQLSEAELNVVRKVTLATQTMLANSASGKKIVTLAAQGQDGIIRATQAALGVIAHQMKLRGTDAVMAGIVVMLTIYDFVVSIKKAPLDKGLISRLIGRVVAAVGHQYGVPDKQLNQMIATAPSEQRRDMNAQRARGGLLGRMMERV